MLSKNQKQYKAEQIRLLCFLLIMAGNTQPFVRLIGAPYWAANRSWGNFVQDVVELPEDEFVKGPCKKIIIFLSVFNVHVNLSPIAGEIKCQKYVCGRFRPAYKDEVGFENERHMLGIENEKGFRVTVTQIAGILARRIVSWVTLDDNMEKGQVYGLIKFGSCTELVVPDSVEVLVKKGDKVRGGESVLGRIK